MKTPILEFDFYAYTFRTRSGHEVRLDSFHTDEKYFTGDVIVPLLNGKTFLHSMTWDRCGESINKDKNPTEYYYDLVKHV